RGLSKNYLIEAQFSVDECDLQRGSTIVYKYAVLQPNKVVEEIATRYLQIPFDHSKMFLFEPHVSCPGFKDWLRSWIKSAERDITEAWESSARILLDRLFEKWETLNQESVSDLIVQKLVKMLNGVKEGKSSGKVREGSSADAGALALGLSVFQVCCGCKIELGIKDWGKICQLVTLMGLMNRCARLLVSELVLLVPVLQAVGRPGSDSGRFGWTVEEPVWAGLQNMEYRPYREKIRKLPDKRRMMLEMIRERRSVVQENPQVLGGWISLMAFEDLVDFGELMQINPEYLLQSLMFRLKESELYFNKSSAVDNTTLQVTEKILSYVLQRTFQGGEEKDQEKSRLLSQLEILQKEISDWRDGFLRKPLFHQSAFTYPQEIEEASASAIAKTHNSIQTCFRELCLSAVTNTCQSGKEGDLLKSFFSWGTSPPSSVLSSIVVESADRFGEDVVMQLLEDQSAAHVLLSRVPEISLLEEEHKTDLQSLTLDQLLAVRPCFCEEDLRGISGSAGRVLFYSVEPPVLDTARQMYLLRESNLLLSLWVDRAADLASLSPGSDPTSLSLGETLSEIWGPALREFTALGVRIARGSARFQEVDELVDGCGDEGDGSKVQKELQLQAVQLQDLQDLEENWVELRFGQIQQYRQLDRAADAADTLLRIRERLALRGDFTHIHPLTQLREDWFKQRTLGSLSEDLISAKNRLSHVKAQDSACLHAFLQSDKLLQWVRDSCRWLDWLKSVRETYGSVEQSSLSLASAINTHGVYHLTWPADSSGKKQLGGVLYVKVQSDEMDKIYSVEDLLELQNKLMLMSSKGECGKDQVNKFTETESLDGLWRLFRKDMVRYLTQYVDVETLATFLSRLSDLNQEQVERKLPAVLHEDKPNLVLCPSADLISTTLSFYTESPEQTCPSDDEVLMCEEDTSEEEVEIFLRRCLGRGSSSAHKKIYTVVNPGLLSYDVGVALAERFEALEKSARARYRLVIISPVNQDRYVPSFFSSYKVQGALGVSVETAKEYLRYHLTAPFHHGSHQQVYPEGLTAWMIISKRAAVKSLYVSRMFQGFKEMLPAASYLPLRLIESCVDVDDFVHNLTEKLEELREQDPVLLHIDAAAVRSGLEEFLFRLLVLGCLSNGKGRLWRRNSAHLITIETLLPHQGLLHLLPTIHCRPPKEVKVLELKNRNDIQRSTSLDPLMDIQEFRSEGIQRPYQYLRRFNRNEDLDHFRYRDKSVEGDPVDCLHHLLSNCGLKDPSWAELKHFTWFLNLQLKDCEISGFCDPNFFAQSLRGFKSFIVKFMIHMARDFASPSLDISDQSPSLLVVRDSEDDLLSRLTIRKKWENQSHPYIFFNADHLTMTFLGFHVKQMGANLNAVDPHSGQVLMGNVMSPDLFDGLRQQRISFSEDFDLLPRENKIRKISLVVGAKERFDPDPTYELTADNVMKMLAIHMRFRCEIPVIIMGETGCGKTRLVKFLCDLQREGRNVENMKLVKVHGGTTADIIYKKVREAEGLAVENRKRHSLDTILFFDEANTTEAIFAIKEVLCDLTVEGRPLRKNSGLKIIAACNPYRRHTPQMIKRLERAGLGYRVKADETEDRLGKVPMRQLVYRVHPLPPSMIPLVWDFGQLSDSTESSYIRQIVLKQMKEHRLPLECKNVITNVLASSQSYMRGTADECSFVSLRDVERSMMVLVWFYQHRDYLFPNYQRTDAVHMTLKCLALALGVCYYPSLELRDAYLSTVSRHFPKPLNNKEALEREIISCQDFFIDQIEIKQPIAKNSALKENLFLMVVCIELRIPLFLVGKPGSSKSLAKTVVADAMQRQTSKSDLFKKLKETHMVSFQCSPHSSPEGIIATFRNCARFQKDKNLDEYVSVVVLDEIGLAEDSPQMPLKTLHPLLEDGCIDNERPDPHMKVGFIGISNWALDPAKMNRGIFVSRWDPSEHELVETANGICASSKSVFLKIKHLLPKLAKGFLSICKNDSDLFFGLRDYYSLVKMIFATVKNTDQEPSIGVLAEAVLRNFSGQKNNFDPLSHFQDLFYIINQQDVPRTTTLKMIEQNLDETNESRYLLLLTTNNAALYIVQQYIFSGNGKYASPEIVFGSGFPKDQEYSQICRNVSRVKTCMETGRTVILLNLLNLYESLYDALNQYYVSFCGQQYVDLGLGSHRVKCRVHKDFRLVVIEDQEKVYNKFPVPLKNRLEKHRVDRSTDLTAWQLRVLAKLENWVKEFSRCSSSDFSSTDAFVGFHGDACASALLQALERRQNQDQQKVTTFSSLLTKADVRTLSRALGLSMEKILLLSLHQFDTEASFCRRIRILLIETDMEESLCKNELIASARYRTMNEVVSVGSRSCCCYVVFITKLSRISSGNKYTGFQGAWLSVHIDDLRDSDEMSLDLSVLCGAPISRLLSGAESAYLHSVSLVKSCSQKAVSLLRDSEGSKGCRSLQRIRILLHLLGDDPGEAARFQKVLLERLVVAVAQKEELIHNSGDWVNKEAAKREALQEGGTLSSEQDVDVQCNLLLGAELRPCSAPFSWIIRLYCQNLWEESQFLQAEQSSRARVQRFVSAVESSRLGGYILNLSPGERAELGQKYLTDFVLLSFKIKTEEEMKVFSAAVLGCVSALQQSMGVTPDLSPVWIMAGAWHCQPRLDALSHTLQLQPHLATPILQRQHLQKDLPDMCEDILALGICVEETKLQPITSLAECTSFLRRVELLQPCLQRALTQSYSALCSPGCLQHLSAI
uniref:RING-type E3 ubiquitin transferase n=1 Tax=Astyanax mexicanus TaxID=7994 RepID=A0A3B1J697_ASTMX